MRRQFPKIPFGAMVGSFFIYSCMILNFQAYGGPQVAKSKSGEFVATISDSLSLPVVIETDGQIKAEEILRGLRLSAKAPITKKSPANMVQEILRWLTRNGYWQAQIAKAELQKRPRPRLRIRVHEGYPFTLHKVRIHFSQQVQSELVSLRELERARNSSELEQQIDQLLNDFGESGYPFAEISIDSIFVHSSKNRFFNFDIVLQVRPGDQVAIDSIRIAGNSITRQDVILRELPFARGDLFKESYIEEIPVRLMRLGFFKSVSEPKLLIQRKGSGILAFSVQEGNSNIFNGVAGYNPGTGSQPGYLTGLLDLKFNNLLGTGRQINAHWEKRNRNTQELALRFREPWLFGTPLRLQGGFQQLIQDTLYVNRQWNLQAEWPIMQKMNLVGQISRIWVTPDSMGLLFKISPSQSTSAGLGLRYVSVDDPINPRHGAQFYTMLESIAKKVSALDSFSTGGAFKQQRLVVDASWNQPLWRFQALHIGVHWRQVTSSEPVISQTDQFRFGGATTLRGYREEQFRGSRIAWANVEYRYLLSRRSRAFLFYDSGYFYRQEANRKIVEGFRQSFGFGVRLETRLGIVGVDYGLGKGDSLLQGKVHVSLLNSF